MLILGIETSCDETAAAVVRDGRDVLSNIIASSQEMFERTGGVIPEEAARRQLECINPVIEHALKDAKTTIKDIDAIAVTHAPGLLGSLLVGTVTARTLAWLHGKPLIPVHHTFGHMTSTWLECENEPEFPILTLSVSGGHTEMWLRTSHTKGTLLGQTRDDAAGEAFDKGASLLGLPYPGGPAIASAAKKGNASAFDFPLPLRGDESLDWSFSGLKTSLRYLLRDNAAARERLADTAASFQEAICRHLVDRLKRAIDLNPEIREVHLVGGVSANERLRAMVTECAGKRPIRWPQKAAYCTDNGAMIAAAGEWIAREKTSLMGQPFETLAGTPLMLES